jgi:dual specificity phosphatase 12
VCEGRPVCEPNVGFTEQLDVWERMCGCEDEQGRREVYDEWARERFTGEVWEWEERARARL